MKINSTTKLSKIIACSKSKNTEFPVKNSSSVQTSFPRESTINTILAYSYSVKPIVLESEKVYLINLN
jgi:hypothetical protein